MLQRRVCVERRERNRIAMKPTLIVLAAGMGSRYGGLKQIDPVGPNGEIMLDYSIFDALRGGFDRVVFVIRKDIEEAFRASVGAKWEKRVRIDYAFQRLEDLPAPHRVPEGREKPWGTGQAVLCAAELVCDAPFAVINADDFYGRHGFAILGDALSKNGRADRGFMVGYPLRNTLSEFGSVSRGVCDVAPDRSLRGVTEVTKIVGAPNGGAVAEGDGGETLRFSGNEIVSMNFWGFMPSCLSGLRVLFERFLAARGTELKSEFYLPEAVATMIRAGEISIETLTSEDAWFGVTYREDKPHVQAGIKALIDAGAYPADLFA